MAYWLPPEAAQEAAGLLIQGIKQAANPSTLAALADGLKAVTKNLDQQPVTQEQVIALLKHLLCVGAGRRVLVDLFNDKIATDEKFDGNVWKLVTWAEQHGLDVRSPPQR